MNLACGAAAFSGKGLVHEALVVAQIQVHGMSVLRDEGLSMLQRAEKGGLGVVIQVELLHAHAIASCLEQTAQRCGSHALAQRGGNASGNKYVFHDPSAPCIRDGSA